MSEQDNENYMSFAERWKRLEDVRDEEFLRFDRVENKRSSRPDIHAFILLNELCPGERDIINGAEHDVYFLDIGVDELTEKATDDQLIELHRCGITYLTEYDCLGSFA